MRKLKNVIIVLLLAIGMLVVVKPINVKATGGDVTVSALTAPATVTQGSSGNTVGFTVEVSDVNTFVAGDTYVLSTNMGTLFSGTTFSPTFDNLTIKDPTNTVDYANVKIEGNQITITVLPAAAGQTYMSGTITTGPTLIADAALLNNQTLFVDNQTAIVKFDPSAVTPPSPPPVPSATFEPAYNPAYIYKNTWTVASDTRSQTQVYVNTDNLQQMIQGVAIPIQTLHDVYFEDVLPYDGKYFPNSIKIYAALETLQPCTNLALGYNNGWRGCDLYGLGTNFTGYSGIYGGFPDVAAMGIMTRVNPNSGEAYSAFKGRLAVGEWGVWTDPGTGGDTIVINFGTLPDSSWLKYSQLVSLAGYGTQYEDIYGDLNPYGGGVVGFEVWFDACYPTVRGEQQMNNTATLASTEVPGGSSTTEQPYTIKMGGGAGYAAAGELNIVLYDEDSKTNNPTDPTQWIPISNANFKIQRSTDGGVTWSDYLVSGNPVTGTTDADGYANLGVMAVGRYRIVQTSTDATHSYAGTDAVITSDTVTSFGTITDQGDGIGTFTIAPVDAFGYSAVITNKGGVTPPAPIPTAAPSAGPGSSNSWLVTFLDCNGNTVKVEWVPDGGNATPPSGMAYSNITNVTSHRDVRPNNCSTQSTYENPNTAAK